MALHGEVGWIGKKCPVKYHPKLRTEAMESPAGWFIGTTCDMCAQAGEGPVNSRESHYYPSKRELIEAYLDGTIMWRHDYGILAVQKTNFWRWPT
jgi:hypothetical protein